jgi:hypothetical protein
VTSSTETGTYAFSGQGYREWFCTPAGNNDYAGRERVFAFAKPEGRAVTITLDSPCERLDLFAVEWPAWQEDGVCPTEDSLISVCEHDSGRDGAELTLNAQDRLYDYLIVVEGETDTRANFRLDVTCD